MTFKKGERKLVAFLNLETLTPDVVDEAFEVEGHDLGKEIGRKLLDRRAEAGVYTDARSVRKALLVGPVRLEQMLARAAAGGLDAYLPEEVAFHPLELLPDVLQRLGDTLIGGPCTPPPVRLARAAGIAAAVADALPAMEHVAAEFSGAAEAVRAGTPAPPLEALGALIQAPTSKEVLAKVPPEFQSDWLLMSRQGGRLDEALTGFVGATWLEAAGPARAAESVLAVSGDATLARDVSLLAPQACRLADAALLEAGVALQNFGRSVETLLELILFCIPFPDDGCTEGAIRNCTAAEVTFVPKGRSVTDADDFENAISLLKVMSYVPGKTVSPGGKGMMREIAKQLQAIKKAADKNLIRLDGYSVFVRLTYEECVTGVFGGTYWKEKSKIVEVDPPKGAKQHPIGKKGWSRKVIEALDFAKSPKKTKAQFKEFQTLAEKQCPKSTF